MTAALGAEAALGEALTVLAALGAAFLATATAGADLGKLAIASCACANASYLAGFALKSLRYPGSSGDRIRSMAKLGETPAPRVITAAVETAKATGREGVSSFLEAWLSGR